jgi:hypothetical protein
LPIEDSLKQLFMAEGIFLKEPLVEDLPETDQIAQLQLSTGEVEAVIEKLSELHDGEEKWIDRAVSTGHSVRSAIEEAYTSVLDFESSGNHFIITIYWDFFGFCDDNLDGDRAISQVPIVAGSARDAYVDTCEEYFDFLWGDDGRALLKFLEKDMRRKDWAGKSLVS